MQHTVYGKTDVNKPYVKADLNVKLQDEISNTIALALLH